MSSNEIRMYTPHFNHDNTDFLISKAHLKEVI